MKNMILLSLFSSLAFALMSASTSFAANVDKNEAIELANTLLKVPSAIAEIKKADPYAAVVDYSVETPSLGLYVFTVKLNRDCFCGRNPGTLTLTADKRPAMADGGIAIYTYKLTWGQ